MIEKTLVKLNKYLWQAPQGAEAEYGAVFEGTQADVQVDVWESAAVGTEKTLLDGRTLSVIRAYAEAGLQIKDKTQIADFLGYETEFLLILLKRKAYTQAQSFWQQHYAKFLQRVWEQIQTVLPDGFYAKLLTEVCQQLPVLEQELIEKAQQLKDDVPTNAIQEFARLPLRVDNVPYAQIYHFQALTPAEAANLFQPQVIRTCGRGDCGGICVIHAHVTAGCITKLTTEVAEGEERVLQACVRGQCYRQTFLNSARLKYPLQRVGKRGEGKFKRISWLEALELIKKKLAETKAKYGVGCRYVHYSTGMETAMNSGKLAMRLLGLDGGFLDRYLNYSNACAMVAIPYTYGTTMVRNSMSTHYKSKLLILWGYNPLVTYHNANIMQLLQYHKQQGTPIIVIDPHYSETAAAFATKWLPIRPGTDAALVAAMAYVLWEEKLCDQSFMDKFCLGFDSQHMPKGYEQAESYRDYVYGLKDGVAKTPTWAAALTGIKAEEIVNLARLYAKTKPAAILAGLGPQRSQMGEQTVRAVMVLPCMTGNVGVAGGGTGARGDTWSHNGPSKPPIPNPYKGAIPVYLWTEAIRRGQEMTASMDRVRGLDKLQSNVKLIINVAGNTLLNQHSDCNKIAKLLEDESKVEFIIGSDIFMTPSMRYCDVVLPGTSMFEEEYFVEPWNEGHYLLHGAKCIDPIFESRDDFTWLSALADLMGIADFSEGCRNQQEWLQLLYSRLQTKEPELPDYERFAAAGGYMYKHNEEFVAFQDVVNDFAHHKFPTASGKIEIFAPKLAELKHLEIPAIPKLIEVPEAYTDTLREQYPLQLLGWHTKRRTHSLGDNNVLLEQVEPHRLWLHPEDAQARNIHEGDLVLVYNDHGKVQIKAKVTERIMQGVVCLPEGAWYTPNSEGVDIRGNVNTLTQERATALGKCNGQHTALVEVCKLNAEKYAVQ